MMSDQANVYSDNLLIKLLEAGDPDHFDRQNVAPFEGNLDNLTRKQVQNLLEWLRMQIQVAKSLQEQEPTTDRAS